MYKVMGKVLGFRPEVACRLPFLWMARLWVWWLGLSVGSEFTFWVEDEHDF